MVSIVDLSWTRHYQLQMLLLVLSYTLGDGHFKL